MSFGGGSSPSPPDPAATAQAQAAANAAAVQKSAEVNQIGRDTPFGSERFTGKIGSPERLQTISLNPEDATALGQQRDIRSGLLGVGQDTLIPQLQQNLGQPFNFNGLPQISGQEDLLLASQPLEQATFQRGQNLLQPEFDRQQQDLQVQLANRGIPIGSEASTEALDRLDRSQGGQLENLALSSVGAGRAEQSRLFGLEQAARQQGIAERQTERAQPINELAALLQGAPAIQSGNFQPPAAFGVAPPDIQGLVQTNFLAQQRASQQRSSDLLGGLFGLGEAGIGAFG